MRWRPASPEEREWYAECLEAVEDIPKDAMMAGIDWTWETFPEYLAAVEALPKAINYGSYIGHSALRMYAMGARALDELATGDDLDAMAGIVEEALRAGAMGLSTSRSVTHTRPDGGPVASRVADWRELAHLAAVMGRLNAGILQLGPDVASGAAQRAFLEELGRVSMDTGRPVMFGAVALKQGDRPNHWQYQMDWMDRVSEGGGRAWGQGTTRSINAIFTLKAYLPFDALPSWRELRQRPIGEQKAGFRDPELRARLVAEEASMKPRGTEFQGGGAATTDPRKPDYANLFPMFGVKWDEPSIEEIARERSCNPVEAMIDLMLENEDLVFVQPLMNNDPDDVLGLLRHPRTLATFSDSGAHVCQEMGSSLQTHMLSYWVRDRQAFTLEEAVRKLTFENASAWNIADRGLLRTGMAADILVFDEAAVKPCLPTVEHDLPGGERRLVQKAEGIDATIVNGEVTLECGESTGAVPGGVIRGPLAA